MPAEGDFVHFAGFFAGFGLDVGFGNGFAGAERAFAVQGGREVRVYVQEQRISDEKAVELSAEIARKISDELTFPGQIKVTVIRESRAVEFAK